VIAVHYAVKFDFRSTMKAFVFLIMGIVSITIQGCATTNIGKSYSFSEHQEKGVIIGSFVQEGKVYTNDLYYRKMDSGKYDFLRMNPFLLPGFIYQGDFQKVKGKLFAIDLEPGKYEFYQVQIVAGTWRANSRIGPFPFTVEKGKVSYVGEYRLTKMIRDRRFSFNARSKFHFDKGFMVSNKNERDLNLISTKYPEIDLDQIIITVNETKQ